MAARKRKKSASSRKARARRSPLVRAAKACKGKKNFKTCRRKMLAKFKRSSGGSTRRRRKSRR